jgi:hypothetical protein
MHATPRIPCPTYKLQWPDITQKILFPDPCSSYKRWLAIAHILHIFGLPNDCTVSSWLETDTEVSDAYVTYVFVQGDTLVLINKLTLDTTRTKLISI